MKRVLIDSGPLIALFDGSDKYHDQAVEFIKKNSAELVTTIASITETLHLLDFNRMSQLDFLDWVRRGALRIENIEIGDFDRIFELTQKYKDLPMDFADACLVLAGEKLSIHQIATIDRDFCIYRLKGKKTFQMVFA